MKKGKIFTLALLLITVFTFNFGAVSAAPESIKVKRAEVLSDAITNHEYGFVYFTTTDGDALYCMDNLKDPLHTGDVAKLADTADAGIQYILENTYPAKPTTDSPEFDKYLAQAAIWWYLDDTNQGDNQLSDEFRNADASTDIYRMIPDYIKPLVEKAKKYKDNQPEPKMEATIDGDALALTSDNKYYESRTISVDLSGASEYTAIYEGGTKGTVIVGEDGKPKTSFKAGEKFKVRIPAEELTSDTTVAVKISATGKIKKAKIYKTDDPTRQRVVGLFSDDTPLVQTINLKASPNTESVEVVVPNTSANILMLSVAAGITIIVAGLSVIMYRGRQKHRA